MARYHFERLSPQDTTFLYMESPTAHMHIGAVAVFEGVDCDIDELYAHIDQRLDLVPRFRRKLMWVPYGNGRPVWVDDADFDVRYHVRHTGLPRPGGEAELRRLTARVMSVPLDRDRPLWELWFVDLPDDRVAMIQKTHHALVDGISGVDLATVLLDLTPDSPEIPTDGWQPRPAPTKRELLRDTLRERLTEPTEFVRSLRAATRAPRAFVQRAVETGRSVIEFGGAALEPVPNTSLNQPIGGYRRFDIVRTRADDVKAVKRAHDCTVNDVVLAMVTGGLRHVLQARGEIVEPADTLTALVPVSVRTSDGRGTFGNQVAGLFPHLPIGVADPVDRLNRLREQMLRLKESNEVLGAEAIMRMGDFAPPTILNLASRLMVGTRAINLTITNVPGPQFPLFLRGGRMIEAFPFVPLTETTDVGVAVLSYDGALNFGLTGDWDTTGDLAVVGEGIEKALVELLERS